MSILWSNRSQPTWIGIHVRIAFVGRIDAFRCFRSLVCNLDATGVTCWFVGVVCLLRLDWSEYNGDDFKSFKYLQRKFIFSSHNSLICRRERQFTHLCVGDITFCWIGVKNFDDTSLPLRRNSVLARSVFVFSVISNTFLIEAVGTSCEQTNKQKNYFPFFF